MDRTDCIIIGGGPAGLSAALYAARYGLDTLLLEALYSGGQIVNAAEIENYPGFHPQGPGANLAQTLDAQVRHCGAHIRFAPVTSLSLKPQDKTVSAGGDEYQAPTIILATGQKPRKLDLPGEDELRGRGISYCATCDGHFYRNQEVCVVGGGDTAVTDAAFLSRICKRVYLIHRRDSFRASNAEVQKLAAFKNVELVLEHTVTELVQDGSLQGVAVTHTKTGQTKTIPLTGLFVAIGNTPNNELFADTVQLDAAGYVQTDEEMRTHIPGCFAAGDIRHKSLRQVVTATADGAIAAHSAMRFLS